MAKQYTAQSVGKNHDWDFSVDGNGDVIALVVKAEVNYGTMGITETVDVWPLLTEAQQDQAQLIYDFIRNKFNSQFLG